jgi:sodium transport system permease protein
MSTFITIFKKEFTDTIRDRRTLFVMIIFPLLLFPLLITAVITLQTSQMRKAQEKVLRLGLVLDGNAQSFRQELISIKGFRIAEGISRDSAQVMIERDSLDAVIVFAPDFDRRVESRQAGTVHLYFKFSDEYNISQRRLRELITAYERTLIARRFEQLNLDKSIVDAVSIDEHDVTPLKEKIGKTIGGFIPYLFVIFCFMGSMYPAIDLASGEKERGTIETLLTAPVSRFQILLGKFAVVVLTGLLSASVSMLGLYAAVRQNAEVPPQVMDTVLGILNAGSILLVLSLLLPLAVFFAAILLSLSFFAKSYKEAQSLISPLTIVVLLPVAIGMIPGIELNASTALIPVLNVSLATKEIIAGTIQPLILAEVYLSLTILAAVSLLACARWFEREETIFRGA